jgi:hypothetical protein
MPLHVSLDPHCERDESQRAALEAAFSYWLGENYNVIEGGGTGDVLQLFASLKAASANASKPALGLPSAVQSSEPASPNAFTCVTHWSSV